MPINIEDVALKAGVCVTTVSRVLNNSGNVRESNRQKVLQAIAELDYNPNAAARTLAKGKSDTLGIILPTLNDPFWADLVSEIEKAAYDEGYLIVLALTQENHDKLNEKHWTRVFSEGRVDGILLIAPENETDDILELRNRDFPLVLLDNNTNNNLKVTSIIVDNTQGGYMATQHLIELGHTKIGHIVGDLRYQSARDRLQGFKNALNQNDISINDSWVKQGDFSFNKAYEIALEWLAKPNRPTAIFAADDVMAVGIVEAARYRNIRIPEELSIIGYDDSPYCERVIPNLSTLRQPTIAMAREAVNYLLRLISNKSARNKTVAIPPELITRESTIRLN